jgi:spermidine/putrescine transport system substrate-binding protein
MYGLGYLEKLDYSKLPNVKNNLIPALRHPESDPHREFTVPWQAGMTGLIVRKDLAPNVNSICDLFDPKYKGKVTMLTEMRDSVPMTLKCMGIDPEHATEEQWLAAVEKIGEAAKSGQIRRFTGNDYYQDLLNGNVDFVLGWSGDAVQRQSDNPNIRFVMPKEGCMLWSTSMEIPAGAPNPAAAEAWMNYVYNPRVQADIAEYVNYVTPVRGVKAILRKRDPELAESQLIFPSQAYTKNCSFESELGGELGRNVSKAFNEVLNG